MRQLVHAEILKLRTLRSSWWMALALLLAVPILIAANVETVDRVSGRLDTSEGIRNVFSGASPPLMLIVGIMLMAGEFRHGTATATFLATQSGRASSPQADRSSSARRAVGRPGQRAGARRRPSLAQREERRPGSPRG